MGATEKHSAFQIGVASSLARYFRLELEGSTTSVPLWEERPCIFVMNHTALVGLEVYLFHAALARLRPEAPRVRTTVWPPFLDIPVLGSWYSSTGCIAASVDGAVDLLRQGESVLILPEGPDATDVRDELGPFHAGFMRVVKQLATEQSVPVVPIGWAGVDEANPWWVTTNPLLVKLLMKPAMPDFDFALLPRPPLLRPSKVVFSFGAPMEFTADQLATEELLRGEVAKVKQVVRELVEQAAEVRAERIADSTVERVLHSAFRMHQVLWRRRG